MQHLEATPGSYTARLTRKGQVTIPVSICRLLGVGAHDEVAFVVADGEVRIAPATSVVARTAGLLKSELPARSPQAERVAFEERMAEEAAGRT